MLRPLLLGSAPVFGPSFAGDLISYSSNGSISLTYASSRIKAVFTKDYTLPSATAAVNLYKVIYTSHDLHGKTVNLSGLVAIPQGGAPKGLVVHYHGTTAQRDAVPSNYDGKPSPSELAAEQAVLAYATGGYAVAAPDYLGLGDSPGFHPYALGSFTCWSGIDMISAARTLAKKLGVVVGPALYISGYSEGGGAAAWAVRKLAEMQGDAYKVTSGALLSGPYDLSGAQAQFLLAPQSNPEWLAARFYFAGYFGYSLQQNFGGVDLKDYFAPSFASYLPVVFNRNYTDTQIVEMLMLKGIEEGALRSIEKVLTPAFAKALRSADGSDFAIRMLKMNDCYDWTPNAPVYMVCVVNDFLVTPENTNRAIAAMRARGVSSDMARAFTIPDKSLTHVTGEVPALVLARRFFDGGFAAVPASE